MEPIKQPRTTIIKHERLSVCEKKRSYYIAKRIFDLVFSSIAIILSSPLFLIISLLIAVSSKGPVLFVHHRIGKNGKDLAILKFRTMVDHAEELLADFPEDLKEKFNTNFKLENDPRVTKIGAFLRKSSLDELPQLFNILNGDMSLVGPRPIIEIELQKYGEYKDKFLSATPGLTGYWQAYARSDCSYEQRIQMELFYIDNASLRLDLKILIATVGVVLRGKGAR